MKEQILYNLFIWKLDNSNLHKENAKALLIEFAKKYRIEIRTTVNKPEFRKALDDFYNNDSGYASTISKLYNSII